MRWLSRFMGWIDACSRYHSETYVPCCKHCKETHVHQRVGQSAIGAEILQTVASNTQGNAEDGQECQPL